MLNDPPNTRTDVSRHLPLLNALGAAGHVSQRTLAQRLDIAVSLVNRLIRELLDGGYLEVADASVRPFAYRLTSRGEEYRRDLSYRRYRSVVGDFRAVQRSIRSALQRIRTNGTERLALYGAGEIAEVVLPLARETGFHVVGVVDDDPEKQGRKWDGLTVRCPTRLDELAPDGVLITTFRHAQEIRDRLAEAEPHSVPVLEL